MGRRSEKAAIKRLAGLTLAAVLALAGAPGRAAAETFMVDAYRIEGENPLPEERSARILAPYLGEATGLERLEAAAGALEAALHGEGFGFYRVVVPPQDVDRTVTLRVLRSTVGSVSVEGAAPGAEAAVRRSLPSLREGDSPNVRVLSREIDLANENPARQVTLTVRGAEQADAVDADLAVAQRSPWSVLVGLDNSGAREPARARLSVGVQHANLFDLDHVLTAVYVTSPEATRGVRQWGLFYSAPIYAVSGTAAAYYFDSSVDSGVVADVFSVSGSGRVTGASYTQHLLPVGALRSSLALGLEDKLFDDQTSFLGTPIGTRVRSRPLALSYEARYAGAAGQVEGTARYLRNLPGGAHNTAAAYERARAGARRDWQALRLDGSAGLALPGPFSLNVRLGAQYANEALIPAEQHGLGGPDSLRALEVRQVLGDRGVQGTVELGLPMADGKLVPIAFWDGGRVLRERAPPGTPAAEGAQDFGLGVRFQPRPRMLLALDWARLTDGVQAAPQGSSRMYAQLRAAF